MPVVFTPYLERLRGDDSDDTDEADGRRATPAEADGAPTDGGRRWPWVAGLVAAGLLALGIRRVAGRRESG